MADFTDSKPAVGAVYPDSVIETSWKDSGPLITPEELRVMHLIGIPLISRLVNPVTQRPDFFDDPILKAYIMKAVSLVELETQLDVVERLRDERHPWDRPAFESWGHFVLRHGPATELVLLSVVSSDDINVWTVPAAWVQTSLMHQRQINLFPFAIAAMSGTTIPVSSPSSVGLIPTIFRTNWVPSLWKIVYKSGYNAMCIPNIVNELIGVVAAMEVLSSLMATYSIAQSVSIGIDGFSQSLGQGPVFQAKLEFLADKRRFLTKKLQRQMNMGVWADTL